MVNPALQQGYTSGGKIHTIFFFPIESAQDVMLFLWIGPQNDRVFLLGSGSDVVETVTFETETWLKFRDETEIHQKLRDPGPD